ncbi:MAG: ABC transporter permease, partial [Holophagales bacterium]|nr:ABC transporter permease [Holophagales bacterium]
MKTIASSVLQDLRLAARGFRRAPGVFATAAFVLALGIGAGTTLWSVAHSVLWRPLPYPDSEQIVRVGSTPPRSALGLGVFVVSPRLFFDWQERTRSFESLAGVIKSSADLVGTGEPERLRVAAVSLGFADVFGVRPAHGRWFLGAEDSASAESVVILGDRLWRTRFGGRTDLIGKTVTFDDLPRTVVGVLPPDFRGPEQMGLEETEVWIPIRQSGR